MLGWSQRLALEDIILLLLLRGLCNCHSEERSDEESPIVTRNKIPRRLFKPPRDDTYGVICSWIILLIRLGFFITPSMPCLSAYKTACVLSFTLSLVKILFTCVFTV